MRSVSQSHTTLAVLIQSSFNKAISPTVLPSPRQNREILYIMSSVSQSQYYTACSDTLIFQQLEGRPLFPSPRQNEPGREKMCIMSYANSKGADQNAYPRSLVSAFAVRCLASIISLDSIAEISRLQLASLAAQAGLCVAWSERSCRGSNISFTLL